MSIPSVTPVASGVSRQHTIAAWCGAALLLAGALGAAVLPAGVAAQQVTVPCQVRSAGLLANLSNYLPNYQGACKNGVAQGQGTAEWRYANEPQLPAPVVWKGRFDNGIFISNKAVLAAKPRDSVNMLLDLGPLADSDGKGGRLWVEAMLDGTKPADVCQPKALHLLVDVHASLASEQVSRQWLQSAYRHWQRACTAADRQGKAPLGLVRFFIYPGFELSADKNGNMPDATVRATASLQGAEPLFQSYTNNAAMEQQQKAGEADQVKEYAANEKRLQALARQYGASRVVDLQALDKNPFRFDDQVLLVGVRTLRVLSRSSATVRSAHRDGWNYTTALAEGADVAKWGEDSRMVAVKVKGRSTDVRTQDSVVLQVLGSQACNIGDCQDYLLLPGGKWVHDKALP